MPATEQVLIKKLQSQIKDLEKNLALNKDILNRLLMSSGSPDDVNSSLMTVIREQQSKNGTLELQIIGLSSDKSQLQSFASQQASDFAEQIKKL